MFHRYMWSLCVIHMLDTLQLIEVGATKAVRLLNACLQVLRIDPHFEKRNEVLFSIGMLSKQQGNNERAVQHFRMVLSPSTCLKCGDT